eukprot:gene13836-16826_t
MIFFLDIDGVMVHANPHKPVELEEDGFYKFNPVAVDILNSVLYTTKDQIILSTSHRYRYTVNKWKALFKNRGIEIKFLSILNDHKLSFDPSCSRKTELLEWIHHNNIDYNKVVIIDDDKSLNDLPKALKQRLVLTNSYTGLNEVKDLKNVLQRRLKKNIFKNRDLKDIR